MFIASVKQWGEEAICGGLSSLQFEFGSALGWAIVFFVSGLVLEQQLSRPRRSLLLINIVLASALFGAGTSAAQLGGHLTLAGLLQVCARSLLLVYPLAVLQELGCSSFFGELSGKLRLWNFRFGALCTATRLLALLAPLLSSQPCANLLSVFAAVVDTGLAAVLLRQLAMLKRLAMRPEGADRRSLSRSFNLSLLERNFFFAVMGFSLLLCCFAAETAEQLLLLRLEPGLWGRSCRAVHPLLPPAPGGPPLAAVALGCALPEVLRGALRSNVLLMLCQVSSRGG